MGTQQFKVVETTSLPLLQQTQIKELEINNFSILIARRENWLNKPENKMRNTFGAIANDTLILRDKLDKARNELAELNRIFKQL